MKLLIIYIAIVNVVAFAMCGIDKRKAVKHKWRISESALLIVSFIGGSLGMLVGMQLFRHKTKHKKFTVTVPVFFILHAALILFMILKGVFL